MSDIIFLNGTSSSGKSTIARALRTELPNFCYYASDQLADAGFRPGERSRRERERFFDGFHRSIAAFADAGNDLIVEHIVETGAWAEALKHLLFKHRMLWVGIHAPLDELQRREIARGDRTVGEALFHLRTHEFCGYDLNVDSTLAATDNASAIASIWRQRRSSLTGPAT